MVRQLLLLASALCVCTAGLAEENVQFVGSFESGKIMPKNSRVDGFFVHTLPNPQSGKLSVMSGDGGFAPSSRVDTKVVESEVVGRQTVYPRAGKYFLRSVIDKRKDYSELNGGLDKPRSKLYVRADHAAVDFDEEGYLGFSIFLPDNLEHETVWDGSKGSTKLLQVQSEGASNIIAVLAVYVPSGKDESHWLVKHSLNDGRSSKQIEYDLGPVRGDLGKWTDFVLRYRFNPFSKRTNAASVGGKDRVFEGNKGILQLWKSEGPVDKQGNRQMLLTKVNLQNEPVGRVPHATSKINWHFRIYKGNWKNQPTSIQGPIWVGFDEIRDGRVVENGTTYKDVHPGGLHCSDRCPDGQKVATDRVPPVAPSNLVVRKIGE